MLKTLSRFKNDKNIKKSVLSTHLIVCILIYIFKLKKIINDNPSKLSDLSSNNPSKLLFLKKITDLGVDLVSKNYTGFLFHLLPYSNKITSMIKNIKKKKNNDENISENNNITENI